MAQTNFNSLVEKMLELDKATKQTAESMDKLDKEFEQLSKQPSLKKNAEVLKKINTESVKLIKTEKELIKSRSQISKLNQSAIREADKITQSLDLELQIKKQHELLIKKEVKDKSKLIALEQRYGKIHKNSVLALERRNVALVKYNKTLDTNSRKFRQNAKAISRNEKKLQRFDKAIKRSQRNIGNYGNSFNQVTGRIGAFVGIYGMIRLMGNAIKIFKTFEKANKRLQAILGVNAEQIKVLSEQAKALGGTTAFTASEVTGLHTELAKLGFTLPQIEASTKGILALAAATGTELASAAELAGATVRIFGLTADETGRVADVLALSTSKSALNMEKLATALPIVGTTAKQAGLNLEQTTALLGTLADRGIDASTSATGLRNIFLELSKQGLSYNEAMQMINNSTDKTATAFKLFGKRSATAAVILSETETATLKLESALNGAKGSAQEMSDVMLDNLAGDITIAKSAWEGFVLSLEEGEGAFSTALRNLTTMATYYLNLATAINNGLSVWDSLAQADERVQEKISQLNTDIAKNIDLRAKRIGIGKDDNELSKIRTKLLIKELKTEAGLLETLIKRSAEEPRKFAIQKAIQTEKVNILKNLLNAERDLKTELLLSAGATDDNTDAVIKNKKALTERNEVIKETIKLYDILLEKANIGTEREGADVFDKAEKAAVEGVETIKGALEKELKKPTKGTVGELLKKWFGLKDEDIDSLNRSLDMFTQALSGWFDLQVKRFDEIIGKQQEVVDGIQDELKTELERIDEAKKAGQAYDESRKKALQDQLKAEQAYLSESLSQQKTAKQRQQNMEVATATINLAAGIINVWKSGNWITNLIESAALAALGLVQISTIKSARFAKGTESVSGYGSPDGVDTVPAFVSKKERIMTVDQNKAMPKGFKNDWIPMAAHYWLNKDRSNTYINNNGEVVDRLDKVVENTSKNTIYGIDGMLKKETKGNHTIYYN